MGAGPDGYVGGIVASGEIELLETYLQNVGLGLRTGDET
jgi:hypothetical protein